MNKNSGKVRIRLIASLSAAVVAISTLTAARGAATPRSGSFTSSTQLASSAEDTIASTVAADILIEAADELRAEPRPER